MRLQERLSRRVALLSLGRAFAFFRFLPRALSAQKSGVRLLLDRNYPAGSVKRYHHLFRANATILILGVPIFRREDVGAGYALVEIGSGGDQNVTALQFAAGSKPERAHGLNRLGLMREAIVEQGQRLVQTSYTGFMTSSPEKSLDQARRALNGAAGEMPCTLGSGDSGSGRTELSVRRFTVPGATRWTGAADILDSIDNQPEHSGGQVTRKSSAFGPTATFLYSVHRAILDEASSARRQFCHNGKLHELITHKEHPSPASPTAVRMTGSIRDQSGSGIAEFSVWFDPTDPSGIPNRIEFHARSFLRLTFEVKPGLTEAQATLPWLIDQQRA